MPDEPLRPSREFLGAGDARGQQVAALQELSRRRFEDSVVCYLLRRYRLSAAKAEVSSRSRELDDQPQLLLSAFYELFSEFPVDLRVEQIRDLGKIHVHNLWNAFHALPFMKAWYRPRRGVEGSGAMVFNWPYARFKLGEAPAGPGVVLHGLDLPQLAGTRMSYVDNDRHSVHLEPLASFLEALDASVGTAWRGDPHEFEL